MSDLVELLLTCLFLVVALVLMVGGEILLDRRRASAPKHRVPRRERV